MPITISIVEDNNIFRASLAELVRATDGFELKAEYSNAEEAAAVLQQPPDIVIVDIVLPGMKGYELIRNIRSANESIRFLVCTNYEDDDNIFKALAAGASGYILKHHSASDIVSAIRDVFDGGGPMTPSIAAKVIASFQKNNNHREPLLTSREKEVLEMAAQGLYNKEIARKMEVTNETIKKHFKNIYHKLQVQNKIEAINKYKQGG